MKELFRTGVREVGVALYAEVSEIHHQVALRKRIVRYRGFSDVFSEQLFVARATYCRLLVYCACVE